MVHITCFGRLCLCSVKAYDGLIHQQHINICKVKRLLGMRFSYALVPALAAAQTPLWSYDISQGTGVRTRPPLADADSLYAFTKDGEIARLDKRNGVPLWRVSYGAETAGLPMLSEDGSSLYIGSTDGHMVAWNTADGSIKWKYNIGQPIYNRASAFPGSGNVAIAAVNQLAVVSPLNGSALFNYTLPSAVASSPAVSNDGGFETVYIGLVDGTLLCVAAPQQPGGAPFSCGSYVTGNTLYSTPVLDAEEDAALRVVAASMDTFVYFLDSADGSFELVSKLPTSAPLSTALAADSELEHVYAVTQHIGADPFVNASALYKLTLDGQVVWQTNLTSRVSKAAALTLSEACGVLYVIGDDGVINAVATYDGSVAYTYAAGIATGGLAVDPSRCDVVFFGRGDGVMVGLSIPLISAGPSNKGVDRSAQVAGALGGTLAALTLIGFAVSRWRSGGGGGFNKASGDDDHERGSSSAAAQVVTSPAYSFVPVVLGGGGGGNEGRATSVDPRPLLAGQGPAPASGASVYTPPTSYTRAPPQVASYLPNSTGAAIARPSATTSVGASPPPPLPPSSSSYTARVPTSYTAGAVPALTPMSAAVGSAPPFTPPNSTGSDISARRLARAAKREASQGALQ